MGENYVNALYNIVWLHEFGWKDCNVGIRRKMDLHGIAMDALFHTLDMVIDMRMPVYTNTSGMLIDKADVIRCKQLAEILLHE